MDHDRKKERASFRSTAQAAAKAETVAARREAGPKNFVGTPKPRGTFKPSDKTLLDRRLEESPGLRAAIDRAHGKGDALPSPPGPPSPPSIRDRALADGAPAVRGEDVREAKARVNRYDAWCRDGTLAASDDVPPLAKRVTAAARQAAARPMTLKDRIEREGVAAQLVKRAPAKSKSSRRSKG